MIGTSTPEPTSTDLLRWDRIRDVGCLACRLRFPMMDPVLCEIHHLTIGGHHGQKRRGHACTIGLCSWHHRGEATDGRTTRFRAWLGPSYAKEPNAFREAFGDDEFLLHAQDELLSAHQRMTSIVAVPT